MNSEKVTQLKTRSEAPLGTVELEFPIAFGDDVITELTFRRMKSADWERMEEIPETAKRMSLGIQLLTGLSKKLISQLDMADWLKCSKLIDSELGKCLQTGEVS